MAGASSDLDAPSLPQRRWKRERSEPGSNTLRDVSPDARPPSVAIVEHPFERRGTAAGHFGIGTVNLALAMLRLDCGGAP
jgi:hypothetical protein